MVGTLVFQKSCNLTKILVDIVKDVLEVIKVYENMPKIPVIAAGGMHWFDIGKLLSTGASGATAKIRGNSRMRCFRRI